MAGTGPAMTTNKASYIATGSAIATTLALAILRQFVERLRKSLQREGVRGLGALGRHALDHDVRSLTHGVDHPLFLGGVLDPQTIALGVHRVRSATDLQRRFRAGLQ